MTTVNVYLEEHLVKKVKVVVPDFDEGNNKIIDPEEFAYYKVIDEYKSGKINLTADDYNGTTLAATEINDHWSEWKNI